MTQEVNRSIFYRKLSSRSFILSALSSHSPLLLTLQLNAQVAAESFPTEMGIHQSIDVLMDRVHDVSTDFGSRLFVARGRNHSTVRATRATAGNPNLDSKGFNHQRVTMEDAAAASCVLRRDFIVGVTERLQSFLALASLELRWNIDQLWCVSLARCARHHLLTSSSSSSSLCCSSPNTMARKSSTKVGLADSPRRYRDLMSAETLLQFERWLEPDIFLYKQALALAKEQEARHGALLAARLEDYRSPAFRDHCRDKARFLGVPGVNCARPSVKGAKRKALKEEWQEKEVQEGSCRGKACASQTAK